MTKEKQEERIRDGTASPPPPDTETQQRAEDYVGLCERLINCCESVTLTPVKAGVQS